MTHRQFSRIQKSDCFLLFANHLLRCSENVIHSPIRRVRKILTEFVKQTLNASNSDSSNWVLLLSNGRRFRWWCWLVVLPNWARLGIWATYRYLPSKMSNLNGFLHAFSAVNLLIAVNSTEKESSHKFIPTVWYCLGTFSNAFHSRQLSRLSLSVYFLSIPRSHLFVTSRSPGSDSVTCTSWRSAAILTPQISDSPAYTARTRALGRWRSSMFARKTKVSCPRFEFPLI